MNPPIAPGGTGRKAAERWRTVWLCIGLALLIVGVYWPVATHGFINFDDPDYVSSNPRVQAGLSVENIRWAFTSMYASNWHPLTWLSHMLDCQLYGLKPAGHHLTSLLLHAANAVLLFLVLRRAAWGFNVEHLASNIQHPTSNLEPRTSNLEPRTSLALDPRPSPLAPCWLCALVAALFALHPLHVESVAWVSERKDMLSAFFFLLTLWAYVCYAEGRRQKAEGRMQNAETACGPHSSFILHPSAFYLLSLVCFALGLMSKPMLVTLPCVLLLLDYWPLGRMQNGEADYAPRATPHAIRHRSTTPPLGLVLEKLPFFALAAASCVVTFLVQRASGAVAPLEKGPFELRLANALVAYARYLGKTVWPSDLAVFYPYSHLSLDSWQVVGAGLLLLAVTAGVLLVRKRQPYLLVGWLWFLGMLVPVIGLVQVGKQSMADRYTYLPHIGLFILLAWGAAALVNRPTRLRQITAAASALVLVGCGILTARQLSYWRDTITLFEHAAAVTDRNFVACAVIGNELAEQGKLGEAIAQCRKALAISPDYPEARNTLGNIFAKQGKLEEAVANYRAAAEADRTYADPRNGLGSVLVKQGKFAEAEIQCREALKLAPMHLPAMYSLATALHSQGKLDEAADYYRQILALDPRLFTPRRLLGNILVAQGKTDEAIGQLQLALKIRPEDADTRTVLGLVLLDKNRADEAVDQFRQATRLQATNSLANYQLALIHQERKETRAAIERFRLALRAQPDWPESLNNLAWLLAANPDASLRDGAEAVALAERACKLTNYKEPLLIGTLAAAYAEAGRFPEAVSAAEKARELALAGGLQEIARKNGELLELYRAGRAYHETN